MKIVAVDNFNRDSVSDYLVAENVPEYHAQVIAEALNARFGGEHSQDHYVVKPDDYQLYKWEP